jgi:hypothetical protein
LSFADWQNFYVITGSSAGALTGLQFVVMTLITQSRAAGDAASIRAFGTPTVVHFCTALLISALMVVPWPSLAHFSICLGLCGAGGVIYSIAVFRHAHEAAYTPDFADWMWFTVMPFIAHMALGTAAIVLWWNRTGALFILAADTLLFLLLGVHNAWDTVTYIAARHTRNRRQRESETDDAEPARNTR